MLAMYRSTSLTIFSWANGTPTASSNRIDFGIACRRKIAISGVSSSSGKWYSGHRDVSTARCC
ncbi:Uncharacterised protein [Mycobacterium tuberculosis]|nr:Uncharacterised protein [Mycobacterium tuberculosis]